MIVLKSVHAVLEQSKEEARGWSRDLPNALTKKENITMLTMRALSVQGHAVAGSRTLESTVTDKRLRL